MIVKEHLYVLQAISQLALRVTAEVIDTHARTAEQAPQQILRELQN